MRFLSKLSLVAMVSVLDAVLPITALGNGPVVGKEAPALTLSQILQAPVDVSATWAASRGKVVVIDFWATWCGPCRKSIPHWNELVDTFKDKPVQFIAITDENEQVVRLFLKQNPIHSWVGMEGVGQSTRDRYGIEGIPTTVIVNQTGMVVAVTHPAMLEPRHIQEVIDTGRSSLPPPAEHAVVNNSEDTAVERVPTTKAVFEISVHRSGPLPPGHGVDCWASSSTSADISGQYASVQQAILTLFDGRQLLLDCRTPLSTEHYDFNVRLPQGASHADRERAVAPMFLSVFGLQVRRERAEREVYVLTVVSTNAPGLTLSGPNSSGFGSDQPDGCKLGSSTISGVAPLVEHWLRKPVIDDTGSTNRYDIRLKWQMSKRELLPYAMDQQVLPFVEEPDAAKEEKLSEDQRRELAAIRGKLEKDDLQKLSAEERENIEMLRAELSKPDDERCLPEPATVIAAVREQLGLKLSVQRRPMPILIVEKKRAVETNARPTE